MKVTIENLPPIASGSFDVRPLTIFIGPNNTGKSRAATLVYALAKALETPFNAGLFSQWRDAGAIREPSAPYDAARTVSQEVLEHALGLFQVNLPLLVDDLLGLDSGASGQVSWTARFESDSGASMQLQTVNNRTSIEVGGFDDRSKIELEWDRFRAEETRSRRNDDLDQRFWRQIRSNRGLPTGAAHYFPSGRGALAESWDYLLQSALDSAASGPSVRLSRRVSDFLRLLLRAAQHTALAKPGDPALTGAVELIEREIISGRVVPAGSPNIPLPLMYSNVFADDRDRFTIGLDRASSSVNELGPSAMILRSIVQSGDLVVIDEPESHLHPENQRHMARAMVRMARAGVTVIAPTHAHTIVHEIGNCIRVGRLDRALIDRLGFSTDDRISSEDVGVYVFRPSANGAIIEEVPFDDEFGYPQETFFEVAQRQMQDSHRIDLASAGVAE
jgi:hypothetical protein